jgi:hypothetical protein
MTPEAPQRETHRFGATRWEALIKREIHLNI